MSEMIAVFLDKDDMPCAPEEATYVRVAVQRQTDGSWHTEKTLPSELDFAGPGPLNKSLRALVAELGGCRVVLAKTVAGIPYHVFTHCGFEVFESQDASDATLTAIAEEVRVLQAATGTPEETEAHENPEDVPITPEPTPIDGVYTLDLIRMQKAHPEVSTKMALREFLKTDFKELRLTFSHVPPWLALDAAEAKATMLSVESEPGRWKIILKK